MRRRGEERWRIDLVDTGHSTMTGGRLKRLAEPLPERFSHLWRRTVNVDLNALLFHRAHGKLATVTAVTPPSGWDARVEGDQVVSFSEKPPASTERINGGFCTGAGCTDYIDGDDSSARTRQRLAEAGELVAYQHDGFWQCVDTLHELRLLRDLTAERRRGASDNNGRLLARSARASHRPYRF